MVVLPVYNAQCALCPVGAASKVAEGQSCPMTDRRKSAESYLYLRGTPADTVYYVKHGSVALLRGSGEGDGDGAPYAVRRAGSFVGLEAVKGTTYVDSARAVSDVTVCAMSRSQVRGWLERPGTAKVMLEALVEALAKDTAPRSRMEGSARQRVARWIQESSHQRTLPRTVIAGLLGMKPETLSRTLAALARDRMIELTRTRIDIRDAARLAAVADGEES